MENSEFEYDVALSFAGEEREYVEKVAECLQKEGIKFFYDEYEKAKLWGKNLYDHFDEIYGKKSKYCVIFISKNYKDKLWTNHERKSAQTRAFEENREYILPARFDNTEIPGIGSTTCYVDLKEITPDELCNLVKQKLSLLEKNIEQIKDSPFQKSKPIVENKEKEIDVEREHILDEIVSREKEEKRLMIMPIFDIKGWSSNYQWIHLINSREQARIIKIQLYNDLNKKDPKVIDTYAPERSVNKGERLKIRLSNVPDNFLLDIFFSDIVGIKYMQTIKADHGKLDISDPIRFGIVQK